MPTVLQIKAEPLTAEAYRLFGQVIGMDKVQMKIVNDRFRIGTINMKCQPFRITHLNRRIKSTQRFASGGVAEISAIWRGHEEA